MSFQLGVMVTPEVGVHPVTGACRFEFLLQPGCFQFCCKNVLFLHMFYAIHPLVYMRLVEEWIHI